MAEPTNSQQLSGLARSIDALFVVPATPTPAKSKPAAEATVVEVPAVEAPPAEASAPEAPPVQTYVLAPFRGDAPPPLPPPTPAPAEMFPMSQMLESLPRSSAGDDRADAILLDPTPVAEPPELPPIESIEPVPDEPVLEIAVQPTTAAVVERVRERSDAEAFTSAVGEYLGGDASARSRAEGLATGLQERLALDPLADAAERLVRAAGDPPNQEHLDFAHAVVNPAVASRLVQRLGQGSDEPRRQEGFALCRRLGRVMANALKGALTGALDKDVRRVYYDALISMGDSVRPMIEGMIADENRFLVRDAVAILGEMGGPRAVELVTSALADTDARVRAEALLAVGKLGDAEAGQLVLGFLEDSDATVRLAAADASGRLRLARAQRPLLRMLEDAEKSDEIIALLRALGQIGDPGAVPAIEKHAVPSLFSKPSTEIRVAAYRALHAIGSPHARELIRQTAQDRDPGVRVALREFTRES
jgi:hypothetical protein